MKTEIIVILILLIVFSGIVIVLYFNQNDYLNQNNTACTEEAKICPDGTSVGRTGPNCEFAPCPGEIVGGDTDEHGCIGSAGYSWNETKQKCVREWEEELKLACKQLGCADGMLFAGSVNSDKYYDCDCGYAKNINPENLVCFSSDEEALADGRTKSEC